MALKIAIIGGGSAYTPGLICAFLRNPDVFHDAELALMDIAAGELEIVARLGQKLAQAHGVALRVTSTQNQKEAIYGADFVLSTFRQGGFEARHLDEAIPLQHRIVGQETVGPGGFFFAMRTLPVIRTILDDMRSSAPGAVLVNYTNPTQIVAEAVTHFSAIPCISICDQVRADQREVLKALRMTGTRVELEAAGLNHATWSTRFTINGEAGVRVMERHLGEVLADPEIEPRVKRQFQLAVEYGRLPNSYLQYYYYRDETLAEALAAPKTRAQEIMEHLPGYYQHFAQQAQAETPRLTQGRGGSVFGDMAVEVIRALVRRDDSLHMLNLPNRGALPDFAPDRIVEAPARVGMGLITTQPQDSFPSEVLGLLHMLAEYQWLAAQSIWSGDHPAMVHALAANPLVLSLSTARRLFEQMVPMIRPWLPKNF